LEILYPSSLGGYHVGVIGNFNFSSTRYNKYN